jgi:hypothetical protein
MKNNKGEICFETKRTIAAIERRLFSSLILGRVLLAKVRAENFSLLVDSSSKLVPRARALDQNTPERRFCVVLEIKLPNLQMLELGANVVLLRERFALPSGERTHVLRCMAGQAIVWAHKHFLPWQRG